MGSGDRTLALMLVWQVLYSWILTLRKAVERLSNQRKVREQADVSPAFSLVICHPHPYPFFSIRHKMVPLRLDQGCVLSCLRIVWGGKIGSTG